MTMPLITNIDELRTHMLDCYPAEGCGVVINDVFIPLPNIASNPFDSFLIEADTYLLYEKDIQVIIHSHTYQADGSDPRTPSKADITLAENTRKPQGIIHVSEDDFSDILFFNLDKPLPLLGREYIAGAYDCHTLIVDYFKLKGYKMSLMPRSSTWVEDEPTLLIENLDNQGFERVAKGTEQPDDVLIFAYGTPYPSHLGVYIAKDTFIHHLRKRPSCEDRLSKYYKQHIYTYRFKE